MQLVVKAMFASTTHALRMRNAKIGFECWPCRYGCHAEIHTTPESLQRPVHKNHMGKCDRDNINNSSGDTSNDNNRCNINTNKISLTVLKQ